MGNREKVCCFNNIDSQIIHLSPTHKIHIDYSNTKYHIMTSILLTFFLFNVDLGKN